MAGLQSWLFVQQGHCSIPLMHGAVGDARCAVRQRAVDDGLPLADVLWATRGGPRPLLGKRGWSICAALPGRSCRAPPPAKPHPPCRNPRTVRGEVATYLSFQIGDRRRDVSLLH